MSVFSGNGKIMKYTGFTNTLVAALCFITALSLQIQVTLFQSPDYLGLRINLTDLLVIPVGIAILITLLTHKSLWPVWRMKHIYLWLATLTIIMGLALVHTHFTFGEISRWALINKFGGWIILLAIMGMGAWVSSNARKIQLDIFIKLFLCFAASVMAFDLAWTGIELYPWAPHWMDDNTFIAEAPHGLMANRNAYALLIITAICLATCHYFATHADMWIRICTHTLYFLIPAFILLNNSRAAFIVLCLLIPLMLIMHRKETKKIKTLLLAILIGLTPMAQLIHGHSDKLPILLQEQTELAAAIPDNKAPSDIANPGDSMRLIILQDAFEMIPQHPLLGSGLGSALLYQEQKHGNIVNLIDSTPLWLLVETGAIGLIIFAAFYVMTARALYTAYKTDEDETKTFHLALLFILIGFAVMSLFHEIMYTRLIWFFLGLGLVLPSRMRQDE